MADIFQTARSYVEAKAAGATDAQARTAALSVYCPPSATSQQLALKAADLEQNWITTGYYTWQEMSRMVGAVADLTSAASSAAIAQGKVYTTREMQAARDAYFAIVSKSADYTATWQKAKIDNALIDSAAFKRWVIAALKAGNQLMREVDIAGCKEPYFVSILNAYVNAFDTVIAVAKSIGGAVLEAGRKVIRAVGWWWPFIKWGAIGFGGLALAVFGYNKLVTVAEKGRSPFDFSKLFPKRKRDEQIQGPRRRLR